MSATVLRCRALASSHGRSSGVFETSKVKIKTVDHMLTTCLCISHRCDGYYTCTCGAFQTMPGPVKSRTCVHLKKALGEAFEAARRSQSVSSD